MYMFRGGAVHVHVCACIYMCACVCARVSVCTREYAYPFTRRRMHTFI